MVVFLDRNPQLPPTLLSGAGTTNQRQSQEALVRASNSWTEAHGNRFAPGCLALAMILAFDRPALCAWGSREVGLKWLNNQLFIPLVLPPVIIFWPQLEPGGVPSPRVEDSLSRRDPKHWGNYKFVSGNGATQGLRQSQLALRGRDTWRGTSPRTTARPTPTPSCRSYRMVGWSPLSCLNLRWSCSIWSDETGGGKKKKGKKRHHWPLNSELPEAGWALIPTHRLGSFSGHAPPRQNRGRDAGAEAGPAIPPGNTALGLLALTPQQQESYCSWQRGRTWTRSPSPSSAIGMSGFLPSHSWRWVSSPMRKGLRVSRIKKQRRRGGRDGSGWCRKWSGETCSQKSTENLVKAREVEGKETDFWSLPLWAMYIDNLNCFIFFPSGLRCNWCIAQHGRRLRCTA